MSETPEHDYTGDPKHCHACALRAFANAELRERAAKQQITNLTQRLNVAIERNDDMAAVHYSTQLAAAEQQIADLTRERDEAVESHGIESGFWGRAAARSITRRKQAEAENARLREALTRIADMCGDSVIENIVEAALAQPGAPEGEQK